MKVRWTIPAAGQLRGIFDFIAADSPEAAARTVRRIRSTILQTARMPGVGRAGRVPGTREIVVPRTAYIVAYRVVNHALHALAVLHGAREWPEFF